MAVTEMAQLRVWPIKDRKLGFEPRTRAGVPDHVTLEIFYHHTCPDCSGRMSFRPSKSQAWYDCPNCRHSLQLIPNQHKIGGKFGRD